MSDSPSRYWIRLQGRVEGPMSRAEVSRAARAGRLSPLHEISEDREHWQRLRDFEAIATQSATLSPADTDGTGGAIEVAKPASALTSDESDGSGADDSNFEDSSIPSLGDIPDLSREGDNRMEEGGRLQIPALSMSLAGVGMSLPSLAVALSLLSAGTWPSHPAAVPVVLGCSGLAVLLSLIVLVLVVRGSRRGWAIGPTLVLAVLSLLLCTFSASVILVHLTSQVEVDHAPGDPAQP